MTFPELSAKQSALLEPGEHPPTLIAFPVSASTPDGQQFGGSKSMLLFITDRRLIVAKDKLVGKLKPDFSIGWADVHTVLGRIFGWHPDRADDTNIARSG